MPTSWNPESTAPSSTATTILNSKRDRSSILYAGSPPTHQRERWEKIGSVCGGLESWSDWYQRDDSRWHMLSYASQSTFFSLFDGSRHAHSTASPTYPYFSRCLLPKSIHAHISTTRSVPQFKVTLRWALPSLTSITVCSVYGSCGRKCKCSDWCR